MTDSDRPVTDRQDAAGTREFRDHRPDDNPFVEVIERLRDEGMAWQQVLDVMDDAHRAVDKAALEEGWSLQANWKVAAVREAPDTPSGTRYEFYERGAATAEEAESMVERHTGCPVESRQTEKVGYSKVA